MSHFLRTAAEVVGAAAIIVATAGAAAPAFTVGALATVGVTASAASVAALAGVAAAGLSELSVLTAKKPQQIGNPMSWQSDPQAGIPHIIGRCYDGGQIVYRQAFGDDDTNETINTVYSTGPISGFEGFYVDGVLTQVIGNQAQILDAGKIFVANQLGAQPEAEALGGTNNPGITAASKLSGLAASTITMSYDANGKKTFTTEPQCGYVVLGTSVYDPRKDSTYPGGDGPQRWNDETTWSFVGYDNAALKALSLLIGYRQNGKLVIGVGRPISTIIVSQFVDAANVADANGWTIGGKILSTDGKWQRLNDILACGGAVPIRHGASIGCMVNTPRVSLATIESSDIIGDWSVQAMQSRRDRINAIVPRYMAEMSLTTQDTSQKPDSEGNYPLKTTVTWGIAAAAPIIVDDYVAFDGGQRQKGIDYQFVTGVSTDDNAPNQVAQLARYEIENAREFGPISLPLKPRWMGYQPGDVVTGGASLTEQGLVGKDMLILKRDRDPETMTVTFTARSETAAKHAFALGQTTGAPATPSVSSSSYGGSPGAGSWTITGGTISSAGGTLPAIIVSGAVDNTSADAVIFEYRPHVDGQADGIGWVSAALNVATTTGMTIGTVAAGEAYDAAVSYRVKGFIGARLILGPATAGALSQARASYALRSQTVTYPVTSDDDSVTIAAFEGVIDDGRTIEFTAGSVTGLASGATYGVFWNLAAADYEVEASPSTTHAASSAYVFLGWTATSASGEYPAQPTAPGGWGGIGASHTYEP